MPKFGFYQTEHKNNNFFSFLQKRMWEDPDAPILQWVSDRTREKWEQDKSTPLKYETLSTKQFGTIISKLSNSFLESGVRENDNIIVDLPISFHLYTCIYSLLKIGAVPVLIQRSTNEAQLLKILSLVKSRGIISHEVRYLEIKDLKAVKNMPLKFLAGPQNEIEWEFKGQIEKMLKNKIEVETVPVTQDHKGLLTFENNSLIEKFEQNYLPLGVERGHHILAAQHFALKRHFPLSSSNIVYTPYILFGLYALSSGATTVIPAAAKEKLSQLNFAQIQQQNCDHLCISTAELGQLLEHCKGSQTKIPNLKLITTIGENPNAQILMAKNEICVNSKLIHLFGNAEVEPMSLASDQELLIFEKQKQQTTHNIQGQYAGKFDKGVSPKILKIEDGPIEINDIMDWMEKEVSKGSYGELVVAGEHVCKEYLESSDQGHFGRNKIRDDFGIVWHRTGEIAKIDENDNLWIQGPTSQAIQCEGKTISGSLVEARLKNSLKLEQLACFGIPQNDSAKKIALAIKPEGSLNNSDIEKTVISTLKEMGIEQHEIHFIENFPFLNESFAFPDYHKLREQLS